ncbi:MAG: hypothetical protein J0H69_05180 [Burkholderiales bacterium]|nr:hypothetical protein [Burkholderiales bacterium]
MSVSSSFISSVVSPARLRAVLWADAASGLALAALQWTLAEPLSTWLGLPVALLEGSALVLLAYVALASWLALRQGQPRGMLTLLVIDNWVWVAGCLLLAFGPWAQPTALGMAWLLAQAVAVAVLAELQWMIGLRGARRAASARIA